MTSLFANAPRWLGLKPRRETVAMVVAGLLSLVALGCVTVARMQTDTAPGQVWTGGLVQTAPTDATPAPAMSSASLVVPKSALALPASPPKPAVHVRNSCDSADKLCVVRPSVLAVPPKRPLDMQVTTSSIATAPAKRETTKKGFSMNPLDHLPDLSGVGRPFSAAGRAVAGWVKWF